MALLYVAQSAINPPMIEHNHKHSNIIHVPSAEEQIPFGVFFFAEKLNFRDKLSAGFSIFVRMLVAWADCCCQQLWNRIIDSLMPQKWIRIIYFWLRCRQSLHRDINKLNLNASYLYVRAARQSNVCSVSIQHSNEMNCTNLSAISL